jgi:hypothetical protein
MKHYYAESVILAVAVVICAAFVHCSISRLADRERVVVVKGLAEREVHADKVTWPLVYKELGNDPAEIYRRIETKNTIVTQFLRENEISDNEISISAPKVVDRFANSWSQENIDDRYVATSVIIVSSRNVGQVRSAIQMQPQLMKKGVAIISEEYGSNADVYEFTGLNTIKPQMIEESTKNARAAAQQFAKDSDSELGKIRRASQGQFSIVDRDGNTPHIKNVRVVSTVEYYICD